MKKILFVLVLVFGAIGTREVFGATGLPFLCKEDPTMTKGRLIEAVRREPRGFFCAPLEKIGEQLSRITGEKIQSRSDLLSVLERSEEAVCDWKDGEVGVDYISLKQRQGFGTFERGCKPGEKVLKFKGRVIMSLMCGNTLWDRRRPEIIREVKVPVEVKVPAEPRQKARGPVQIAEEKKCEVVVESNPSPPISVGVLGGVSFRGTGVITGSSMSIGASHRQEYKLCK